MDVLLCPEYWDLTNICVVCLDVCRGSVSGTITCEAW